MDKTISMPISIYALGGLGEVGKNMYCIENEETIIIIDCGVRFPGVEFPGIDYVVPDFTHLKNNRNKVKALFITHGHEDHIGGIPFLIQSLNIPVIYAPRLAAALIRNKMEESRMSDRLPLVEYVEPFGQAAVHFPRRDGGRTAQDRSPIPRRPFRSDHGRYVHCT